MSFPSTLRLTLVAAIVLHSVNGLLLAAEEEAEVEVPESISAVLSGGVTAELNRLFAVLPNGATARFSAGAGSRVDGTLVLDGKSDITIDGNGVLFRAFDPGEDHAKSENDAGWRRTAVG